MQKSLNFGRVSLLFIPRRKSGLDYLPGITILSLLISEVNEVL